MKRKRFRFSFRAALVFFLLYLLFAWKLSWPEVVAALIASCVVALIAWVYRIGARFKIRPGWMRLLFRRTILRVFTDTALVFAVLARCLIRGERPDGRMLKIPIDPGGNDPYSRSRRALIAAFVSFPPNTIAVFIDEQEEVLILHQLFETSSRPGRGDRRWPL